MSFFSKHLLSIIVFITGACVLVIEVVALRILSPYYGTTIYAASSIIGVILAALSVGYSVGGRCADRWPSFSLFFGIIAGGGLSVLLLHIFTLLLLPLFGYSFSIVVGPLVWAMILFFIPGLLLGMLSPFAITLQSKRFPDIGIGTVSGAIFFWSTCGSIFGSLFCGFYLIPNFGINAIVLGVGLLLTVLGLFGMILTRGSPPLVASIALCAIIEMSIAQGLMPFQPYSEALYNRDGVYTRMVILDHEYEGRPARFMLKDQNHSGAMYLDSSELAFPYTQYLALLNLVPEVRKTLVIGAGPYSMPKAILSDFPEAEVHAVDIEPSLLPLAKEFFNLEESPRLVSFLEDGRRFLYDSEGEYDLIFSDVYQSLYSIPTHFTTTEFFSLAKEKLSEDGLFIVNVIGMLSEEHSPFLFSEIRTFREIFPEGRVFAVTGPDYTDLQNFIFVASNSGKTDLSDAQLIASNHSLLKELPAKSVDLSDYDFSEAMTFTDNYAPVEQLMAITLAQFKQI